MLASQRTVWANFIEALNRVGMVQKTGQQRMKAKMEELERKKDQEINAIQTQLNLEVRKVQNRYKLWAVVLPPIAPFVTFVLLTGCRFDEALQLRVPVVEVPADP